ncbi:MAG: flagellar regulator YcgR PilZN domain-containing protein, partial [Pigmentiphaga sp.]
MITHDPQYLLNNPVEIGSALKELLRGADRLGTIYGGEVLPVYLTDINVRRRTVSLLPYGGDRERALLASATKLLFKGAAYGTPIEFKLGPLQEVEEFSSDGQNRVALQAPFPQELYRMQRRQFFRAPVAPPNTRHATWKSPGGQLLVFRIQDISLS